MNRDEEFGDEDQSRLDADNALPPMSTFDNASCWTKSVEQDKRDRLKGGSLEKAGDCILNSMPM